MSEPPPDGYAADPQVAILWTSTPAYTGNTGAQSGKSLAAPQGPPPTTTPILVDLATLQSAENSMLSTTSTIVDAYNDLNQAVVAEIAGGTFFGQNAQYTETGSWESNNPDAISGARAPIPYTHVTVSGPDTGLQQMAQEFAAQINPAMTQVLRAIAQAMETVGVYIALLNNTGQAYSAADIHSFLPPVPHQIVGDHKITGDRWNRDG
jgi:hypothetical protein